MRRICLATSILALAAGAATAQSGEVRRSLTEVTPDIWRFDNNFHVSMVVVTKEGAVVTDPINAEAATIVAHENYQPQVGQDWGPTEPADILYSDGIVLEHGGKTFETTFVGEGHGTDMAVTIVRPDNVAFVVDIVSPGRLPWRNSTSAIDGMIEQIRATEALDFEILVPGHAGNGTMEDVVATREYLEELRAKVAAELEAGKSLEEIQASVEMPEYSGWMNYEEWLPLNIEGVVTALQ